MAFLRLMGDNRDDRFELGADTLRAGRAMSNQIRLDDPAASREHFELRPVGENIFIRDLGSRNGTLVNGVPLRQEIMLLPGDEITVGRTRLVLMDRDEDGTPAPTAADSGTVMYEAEQLSRFFMSEVEKRTDQRATRNVMVINELAREFLGTNGESELLERLTERMVEVFSADRCAVVYRSDEPSGIEVKSLACARPNMSQQVRISTTAARRVLDDKMAFFLADVTADERFRMQHSILQDNITSILCAPLWHESSVFGLLYLDTTGRPGVLGKGELALLSAFANLAAIKIDNLRLVATSIASARMERDLALAAEIQQRMLPQERFVVPGFDCSGFTRACYEVGGDFYDFIQIDDHRFAFTVADVSGKGASGALLMASVKAMLTVLVETGVPLVERVERLNRYVRENSTSNRFVTLFHGEVDASASTLRFCNAGHNPPIVKGDAGSIQLLNGTGPVLGLLEIPYREDQVPFPAGSWILAYSDGVTEAADASEEEYGNERLEALVSAPGAETAEAMQELVLDDVNEFTGGAPQQDDVTLVVVRRL